jgi:SAM-dependent methyltransferase
MLHHVGGWEQAFAEVVRVLRPGGRLAGYDLVDTKVNRLLHVGEHKAHAGRHNGHSGEDDGHDGVSLASPGQLHAELDRLPVSEVRVRPAFAGFLARFTAVAAPS